MNTNEYVNIAVPCHRLRALLDAEAIALCELKALSSQDANKLKHLLLTCLQCSRSDLSPTC